MIENVLSQVPPETTMPQAIIVVGVMVSVAWLVTAIVQVVVTGKGN